MAIAGKVAISPGGEWSLDVAYDKLIVVTFGNNVYLSIKPSTGIEPTNEEYWMLLIENVTQEQYDEIINGTKQVGDSAMLGGKGASEYVSVADAIGSTKVSVGVENNKSLDMLYFEFSDGTKKLLKYDNETGRVSIRDFDGTYWDGVNFATTADLANYLNLGGGRVKKNSTAPLEIDGGGHSQIAYYISEVLCGGLGFSGVDKPTFTNSAWNKTYELFHTGNKPSGSYTGNGSAESRTIVTGGLGNAVKIVSELGYTVIITNGTSFGGNTTSYLGFDWNACHVAPDGNIVLGTAHEALNKSGIIYQYEYL